MDIDDFIRYGYELPISGIILNTLDHLKLFNEDIYEVKLELIYFKHLITMVSTFFLQYINVFISIGAR